MNVRSYAIAALSGLMLLGVLFGCGSATNNDQGVSFLFVGFYPPDATKVSDSGLVGMTVPISEGTGTDNEPTASGGGVLAAVGVQNNLAAQGIRVQRIYYSYFIEGSTIQPPSTSAVLTSVLGPGSTSTIPSTLPDGFKNLPSSVVAQVRVVPFEIREWMGFNRSKLPEPPFNMNVTAYVTGITTAGDRLDTNTGDLRVTVVDNITIPPASGDGGSSSAGAVNEPGTGAGDGSGQ